MPPTPRYQALNPLAVASAAIGPMSIAAAFASTLGGWLMLTIVPAASVVLGWASLRQMRKAPGEWIGRGLARSGIGLALGTWLLGSSYAVMVQTEVPPGYTYVPYESLQPNPEQPTMPIPQKALDMQDKKIFLRGFMQPRRQQTGIREFILCPTSGDCPFCIPNPRPTEMIRIILQGDLQAVYTTHLIGVAGRFRVDPDDSSGVPYALEADILKN